MLLLLYWLLFSIPIVVQAMRTANVRSPDRAALRRGSRPPPSPRLCVLSLQPPLLWLVSRSGGADNARGASSSWRRTGRPQNNRSLTRAERRSGRMRMRTPVIRSLDYYIRRSLFVVFFVRGVVWGSWGSLIVVPDKLR